MKSSELLGKLALVAAAGMVVAGCASSGGGPNAGRYSQANDAYPTGDHDMSQIKDAVPREEPLASSGNSPTYEVLGHTYHVLSSAKGYNKVGLASFYGTKFNGHATSSGERYDMYKMTAASTVLPLPTYVRVTNLANGRHVIVKVNDRGPFHSERIMDLSYAAAYKLGYLRQGTARVRIEAIDPATWNGESDDDSPTQAATDSSAGQAQADAITGAADSGATGSGPEAAGGVASTPGAGGGAQSGGVYLQVAALGSAEGAEQLRQRLEDQLGGSARVQQYHGIYRVQAGPYANINDAQQARSTLAQMGYANPITVSASD